MKKQFSYFIAIFLVIAVLGCSGCGSAYSQTKFGLGLSVGETVNFSSIAVPTFGPTAFVNIGSSFQIGSNVGFLLGSVTKPSGTSSGDQSATIFLLAPYAKVAFAKMKSLTPYFKANIAYFSASVTQKASSISGSKDVTTTNSMLYLWGAVGVSYDLTKGITLNAQCRLVDLGLSNSTKQGESASVDGSKTSLFGLGPVSVGIDIEL